MRALRRDLPSWARARRPRVRSTRSTSIRDAGAAGLGTELLAAAERTLRTGGFCQAILWVLEGNQRGRSFYETQGWRPDGALKIEEIGGVQVTELRYQKGAR